MVKSKKNLRMSKKSITFAADFGAKVLQTQPI